MDETRQRLSQEKLEFYRQNVKQVLGAGGHNLFAEMVLRVLASHDALQSELEHLQRIQQDRDLELEFLSRENKDLRDHIAALEAERRQLLQRLTHIDDDVAALRKHNNLKRPPSWDS